IFQTDQRSLRSVVDLRADGRLDVLPGQNAPVSSNRARETTGIRSHHCHLPVQHMRARLADDLLSMLRMQANRNLIPHSASRNENGGLTPKDLGSLFLQPVDRRVFTIDIVAYLC